MSRSRIVLALLILLVMLAVLATFWPVLSAQAVSIDDDASLFRNPMIQQPGWTSLKRMFGEVFHSSAVEGYYEPLTLASLMTDVAMGGQAENLTAFHVSNLIFHLLNTALIAILVYVLFDQPWVAAATALLFGLHPLTVEPVAWVWERKTLLATFFGLLCLLFYVLHARRPRWGLYGAALLAMALGLLAKPTLTPMPVLLLLLDFWPLKRLNWRTAALILPFLAVAACSAVITVISTANTGRVVLPAHQMLGATLLKTCYLIAFYMGKISWPLNLSPVYQLPQPMSLTQPAVLMGVIVAGVLSALLLVSLRWTRAALMAGLFFVIAISPTLGVVSFTWVSASDKYVYFPAIGLLLALAALMTLIWEGRWFPATTLVRRMGLLVLVLSLAGAEAWATRRALDPWRNSESLWSYTLTQNDRAWPAYAGLSGLRLAKGDAASAAELCRRGIEYCPEVPDLHINLGVALHRLGKYAEALAEFKTAEKLRPDAGAVLANMGLSYEALGDMPQAEAAYRESIQRGDSSLARNSLGVLLLRQERLNEAADQLERAVQLEPGYMKAQFNLGVVLLRSGRKPEAIEHFRRAVELEPRIRAAAEQVLGNPIP